MDEALDERQRIAFSVPFPYRWAVSLSRQGYQGREGIFFLERLEPMPHTEFGSFRIPTWFAADFPDQGVRIEVEVEDGKAECVAIRRLPAEAPHLRQPVFRPPLTVSRLKKLRLDALVRDALRFAAFERVHLHTDELAEHGLDGLLAEHKRDKKGYVTANLPLAWRAGTDDAERVHRTGKQGARATKTRLDDALLQQVAATYKAASGKHPRQAVAGAFYIAPSTASKWIKKTEQAGYLPKTSKGHART